MDYALLPPEVNSGRMYAGPGSGSMSYAASAWDGLAVELQAAANSYFSTLSILTAAWRGPSAMQMAGAGTAYAAWLQRTAVRAAQAATQARAAVDAYETAFAAMVPPTLISTNRSQLASLVATNTFGQNVPAIAAVEAQYAHMWAQDATAMYDYAGSAAAAAQLAPFTPAPQATNPTRVTAEHSAVAHTTGTSVGGVQSALSQLGAPMSTVPSAPGGATTPAQVIPSSGTTPLLDLLSPSSPLSLATQALGVVLRGASVGSVGGGNVIFGMNLSMLWMQAAMSPPGVGAAFGPELATATAELGYGTGAAMPMVSAAAGGGVLAGSLSVPPSWAAATPTVKLVASALQGAGVPAAPAVAAKGVEGLISQMTFAGLAGGVLGKMAPPVINVTSVRRADTERDRDDSKPSKFERVLAELSQKPESVQHWHTDKAQLESLLDQLSKKPGTHAVHVHTDKKKRGPPAPETIR